MQRYLTDVNKENSLLKKRLQTLQKEKVSAKERQHSSQTLSETSESEEERNNEEEMNSQTK